MSQANGDTRVLVHAPSIHTRAKKIVFIKHDTADQRLGVKQSHSHGCWSLTGARALSAPLCHSDAASLIFTVHWDEA